MGAIWSSRKFQPSELAEFRELQAKWVVQKRLVLEELVNRESVFDAAQMEECEMREALRSRIWLLAHFGVSRLCASAYLDYKHKCHIAVSEQLGNAKVSRNVSKCETKLQRQIRLSILTDAAQLSENAQKELLREYNISQWVWKAQKIDALKADEKSAQLMPRNAGNLVVPRNAAIPRTPKPLQSVARIGRKKQFDEYI